MNRKILIICLIAAVITSMGVVTAYVNDGVELHIPDGYSYSTSYGVTCDISIDSGVMDVYTKGSDEITLAVIPVGSSTDQDLYDSLPAGFTKKTIGDKTGYFKHFTDGDYGFNFLEDGKKVSITAPDLDTLEYIVTGK